MSMASMVQIFPPHEHRDQYNYEGYHNASSAAFMSSQLAFNGAPANTCNEHKLNGGADPMWESHKCSPPQLQGPFTPAPLPSSHACSTHHDDPSSYMDSITRSVHADLLSFSHNPCFDMDFPFAEENHLLELMGLQRKLSMYSGYGDDDHDLSQDSIAAAEEEKEGFLQVCSYSDEVKLSNLARSFTFPPAGARAAAAISSCGVRSPLILRSEHAEGSNLDTKHFNHKRVYRENSSAATTSCSNGDEGDFPKGKDGGVKIESSEVSQCSLGSRDQQGCIEQIGTTLSSRGYKQNRKRTANISNSSTSLKAARLDTPPDVVHVRARRGQATDSHSLAERVRREKISQRMKVLQEIVPGCHKVLGKAMMLDEIINYVKSLQKQVEFLSMKLAAANQVGMASMITNEVKFLPPNVELFAEFSSSCQAIKLEPILNPLIK